MKLILRILVVEDSEDDTLLNLLQIKKGGYDVYYERVETAETFIAAINSKNWDIIFSDYKMPRFSGIKALMLLKESGKDIPFIIISAVIGEEIAVEAMKSGAHDYIMKNNLQRLLPAVERELHESEERAKKRVLEQKQKQVEETLHSSKEGFRTLYDNVKIGLYRTTPDGTILMANKTLVAMLGFSSFDELAKRKLEQEGFELHQQRIVFLEMIERNGEIENFESTWIRQDGTPVFVSESARAIRDSNGDTLYYDGSVEDITKRKLSEEALRESKNILQNIIDNSPSLIYILDLDGKFILANRKLAEVLNLPTEKLMGKSRQPFMAKELADQHRNNDLQVITTKQSFVYEEEILESDGLHTYLAQKFPLFNSEGELYAVGGISTDITGRKRMEETLRYERSLLRLLIDNVPDLMYTKDTACRKTLVNKADVLNMGVKFESEVIGKDDFVFFPKEMADKFYTDDLSVMQTGQPLINKEEYTINDNGQEKWLLTSKFPLRDESGQIIGLAGIGRDITERKRTEAALLDSERRYRLLVETVNEGILVAQNGYLKFGNPMMQVITGFTHEELMALPFIDYVHPEDREIVINNHMKRLNGEQLLPRYQFRLVKKDGSSRRIEMNGIVIEWEGQPATLNMLTDITERKQAEEAFKNERTLLRLLIDNVPDLIYAKDTNCRKTLANNADVQHIGAKSESEVLGKDDFAFHPKEIAEKFFADDLSVIQTGQPLLNREEFTIDQEGQKKWLLTSKFPLRDVKGQIIGLVGITHDITQIKQVEEKIKLKNEQLQILNAEKDKFFSIVAHDLRSPLGSFIGIAELLVAELPNLTFDKIQWYALKMRDSATNLFRFLDNLLEWAKMQRGLIPFEPGVFQLSPVIDECLVTLKETAQKKRIEITTDIPHQLEVLADKNMFNSVIRNLVSNAIKFTPHEGKISILARKTDEESIEIAIKDTGIGMDSKMVDNLFQVDAQTNRKGTEGEPSSGLGLLLCKEFIKKHYGNIWVESEEKKLSLGKAGGTTFYFTIPQKAYNVTTEI